MQNVGLPLVPYTLVTPLTKVYDTINGYHKISTKSNISKKLEKWEYWKEEVCLTTNEKFFVTHQARGAQVVIGIYDNLL